MAEGTLYLGIDLGTSGCRALAMNDQGESVASHAIPYPASQRQSQEATLWWHSTEAALSGLLAKLTQQQHQQIRAIAVDGTSSTLLLCDEAGQPLTTPMMYHDQRAKAEAQRIARIAPQASAAHGSASTLAKLLWLQQQGLPARCRYLLHQADWVMGRLGNCFGISDENNSLKLGYDPISRTWPQWLDELGVDRSLLPRVVKPGTEVAQLAPALAQRWGLHASVAIVAGTTDSTAAVIASGASEVGEAVTSLGSTLVMKVIAEVPLFAPQQGVYSQPLRGKWLVGGASNSGGAVLRHFFEPEQIEALTKALRPDTPTGLDYYPLIEAGERFPIADPNLAPRLEPRPADELGFFQAMLEGMAKIEASAYRRLEALGAPYPTRVYSLGGGAKNRPWSQIRERYLGIPVITARHQEAAYGSACLARDGIIDKTE